MTKNINIENTVSFIKDSNYFSYNEIKFRALIEKSFDVIVVINSRGKLLYASPSIVRLYGRSYNEIIGINGLRYVHPIDIPKIAKLLGQIILNPKKLISVELRIKHKNGEWRWVSARATNLLRDEHVKGIVVNFHDITDRKILEDRKDQFISLASHELKTPITSLKAYAQLLKNRYHGKDDFLNNCLNRIESQLDRVSGLITEMLDVSRIQEGKISLQKSSFLIRELVVEVVEDIRQLYSDHEIIIKTNTRAKIYADRFRITQIIINLLTNAAKYSPKNSKILVYCRNRKKEILLSVRDYGVGIDKENKSKIFQRFFQAKEQNKHGYGLGLGLFISATLVKQHGGKIWVKSKKGKGSLFSFTLPKSNK